MIRSIQSKQFEIFCGTGGVGKTTLATSRALFLANSGKKVLLMTIDPAKRLKEILKMSDDKAGTVENIDYNGIKFDALLMSPKATFNRLRKSSASSDAQKENRIIEILARPYGGMNEILAITEVRYHLNANAYDTIILDTPPGKHFLDFLESCKKINDFFDKSFIDLFKYLGKSIGTGKKAEGGILDFFVSSGIKKLLGYLESVTGKEFVDDFVEAILLVYQLKDAFLEALSLQENFQMQEKSNWFLVTSAEQYKLNEAIELKKNAIHFMHSDSYCILNKCIDKFWNDWERETTDKSPLTLKLKESMMHREIELKKFAEKNFNHILCFNEIFSTSPSAHVEGLMNQWPQNG